jgi:hypothetical protein
MFVALVKALPCPRAWLLLAISPIDWLIVLVFLRLQPSCLAQLRSKTLRPAPAHPSAFNGTTATISLHCSLARERLQMKFLQSPI